MYSMRIKQDDTLPLRVTLTNDAGVAIDLNGVDSVTFKMRQIESEVVLVSGACTIVDADIGEVQYEWVSGETDTPDMYVIEFVLTTGSLIQKIPTIGVLGLLIMEKV